MRSLAWGILNFTQNRVVVKSVILKTGKALR